MATGAKFVVQYRRKRELKTNYRKRLNLLKSGITRFVARPSNKHIVLQLVNYEPDGDKVVLQAFSKELADLGWTHSTSNIPAAYLTGLLLGSKAAGKFTGEVILDEGFHLSRKGSRIYAAVKGALDGGLKVRVGQEMLPDEKRIKGEHVASHVERSKNIVQDFDKIKGVILKGN